MTGHSGFFAKEIEEQGNAHAKKFGGDVYVGDMDEVAR
jgi:hypothetical protein